MKYLHTFAGNQGDSVNSQPTSQRAYIRHEVNDNVVVHDGGQVSINVRLEQNNSSDLITKVNNQVIGSQLDLYKQPVELPAAVVEELREQESNEDVKHLN